MGDCDNNFNQTQTQTHANFHNHTHTHRCARPLVITTLENAASASAAVAVTVAAERWLCPSVGTVENGQIVTVDRIALFFLFLLLKVHTPPPLPVALLRRISQGKHTQKSQLEKSKHIAETRAAAAEVVTVTETTTCCCGHCRANWNAATVRQFISTLTKI